MLDSMAPDNQTANKEVKHAPWGTLEELLLACAVNRHGTKRWDSIAMEVRSRRTSSNLCPAFSPLTCRRKYHDLRRRFAADESGSLVDALRHLRVAELRREVQSRDVSIVSLQSKVKKLEEERERSLKGEEEERREVSDLKEEDRAGDLPDTIAGKSISGDVGSFNESNSTSQKCENRSAGCSEEPRTAETAVAVEPEIERTGSENRTAVPDVTSPPGTTATEEDGGESAAESKRRDGKKPGSDVQSSASLSRRTKRRRRSGIAAVVSSSGHDGDCEEAGEDESPASSVKIQPLVRILEIIRSHKLGSAFERRLRSQDAGRSKNLIRKHMDLATIQSRLHKGLYSGCHQSFFRDLLLIFHNGVVFFNKNTPEHHAASELQTLVSAHMAQAQTQVAHEPIPKSVVSTEPDAKVTAAVAPKRVAMPKSDTANTNPNGDKKTAATNAKAKLLESLKRGTPAARKTRSREEKPAVSGKRSRMRRNGIDVLSARRDSSAGESISGDEPEPKKNKNIQNGKVAAAAAAVTKKRGAADFLKRMRQNSPNDMNKAKSDSSDSDNEDNGNDDDEIEEAGRREGMRDRTRRRATAAEREEGGGGRGSSRVTRAVGRPSKRSRPAAAGDGDGRTRKRPRWGRV